MTIYDFSTGDNNDYRSQLTVPKYEYYKKPLRPLTGDEIDSFVYVNEGTKTFTGLKPVTPGEGPPTDPQFLTNDQASRGVQLFFRPEVGYVDAIFSVVGFDSNCTLPNGGALGQALIVKDDPTSTLTFSEFETLAATASAYYDLGHLVSVEDQGGEYDSTASVCDSSNTYLPPKDSEEGSLQMLVVFKGAHYLTSSISSFPSLALAHITCWPALVSALVCNRQARVRSALPPLQMAASTDLRCSRHLHGFSSAPLLGRSMAFVSASGLKLKL